MARRHLIVLCAIASQIAISLVQFGLPALTLALRNDRGVSTVEFAFLFGATGVGPAVALIAAGRLCDRIGARPVLIFGSLIGAAGLTAAGFAPIVPADVRGAADLGHRRRRGAGGGHDRDPDPLPARPPRAHPRPAPDGRARGRVRRRRSAADPLPLRRSGAGLRGAGDARARIRPPVRLRGRPGRAPGRPAADARVVSGAAALGDADRRAVRDHARRRAHVHGQRRARRRAVGDRRGDRVRRAQPRRRRRPASCGASRPTAPAARVASRRCRRSACSARATRDPVPVRAPRRPRAGRDRGRAAGVRHARLQRHRVRDRRRGGGPLGRRRGRCRVDRRVPDRIDHAARVRLHRRARAGSA